MKVFVICSKKFYDKIPKIKKALEENGHVITLPNCFDDPETEERYRSLGQKNILPGKPRCLNTQPM